MYIQQHVGVAQSISYHRNQAGPIGSTIRTIARRDIVGLRARCQLTLQEREGHAQVRLDSVAISVGEVRDVRVERVERVPDSALADELGRPARHPLEHVDLPRAALDLRRHPRADLQQRGCVRLARALDRGSSTLYAHQMDHFVEHCREHAAYIIG